MLSARLRFIRTSLALLASLLFLSSIFAQDQMMISADLVTGQIDSFPVIQNTNSIQQAQTFFNYGNINTDFELLDNSLPTENLIEDAIFTKKRAVDLDFDTELFPIRTSVQIFQIENGEMNHWCSGSMISEKHVLTAAHCLAGINSNDVISDSILICPIFNNGELNTSFECSAGEKIYFIKNWALSQDIGIIALQDPIGKETGWLGIGYNEDPNFYEEGIYYKFSYPGIHLPPVDPIAYNGDTLYYNYGNIDWLNSLSLGVFGASGIPGESGSSLTLVENEVNYTTYGVMSYSGSLSHVRMQDWMYLTFEEIIANDITSTETPLNNFSNIDIYPNPTDGIVNINYKQNDINEIQITNALGKVLFHSDHLLQNIDFSSYPNGIYYLTLINTDGFYTQKIQRR